MSNAPRKKTILEIFSFKKKPKAHTITQVSVSAPFSVSYVTALTHPEMIPGVSAPHQAVFQRRRANTVATEGTIIRETSADINMVMPQYTTRPVQEGDPSLNLQERSRVFELSRSNKLSRPNKHSDKRKHSRKLSDSDVDSKASVVMSYSNIDLKLIAPDLNKRSWEKETIKMFDREISQLPIASDIPRLAPFSTIVDSTQSISSSDEKETNDIPISLRPFVEKSCAFLFKGTKSWSSNRSQLTLGETHDNVLSFLNSLYLLCDPDDKKKLRNSYNAMIDRTLDLDIQKSELKSILQDISNETLFIQIIKSINQSIISQAAIFLRIEVLSKIQMKDSTTRPWEIIVEKTLEGIKVTHLHRQTLIEKANPAISFIWNLSLFLHEKTVASVTLSIVEFQVETSCSVEFCEKVKGLFRESFTKNHLCF